MENKNNYIYSIKNQIKESAVYLILVILGSILQINVVHTITKHLPQDKSGDYFVIMSTAMILSSLAFVGYDLGVYKFFSKYIAFSDFNMARKYLKKTFQIFSIFSILIILYSLVNVYIFSNISNITSQSEILSHSRWFWVAVVYAVFNLLTAIMRSIKRQNLGFFIVVMMSYILTSFFIETVSMFMMITTELAVLLTIISMITSFLILFIVLRKNSIVHLIRTGKMAGHTDNFQEENILWKKNCYMLCLSSFMIFVQGNILFNIIEYHHVSIDESLVGFLAFSVNLIIPVLTTINSVVKGSINPVLTPLWESGKKEEIKKLVIIVNRSVLDIIAVLALIFAFAENYLLVLFNQKVHIHGVLLTVLLVYGLSYSFPLASFAYMLIGNVKKYTIVNFLLLGTFIVVSWIALSFFGIWSLLFTFFCYALIKLLYLLIIFKKHFGYFPI